MVLSNSALFLGGFHGQVRCHLSNDVTERRMGLSAYDVRLGLRRNGRLAQQRARTAAAA